MIFFSDVFKFDSQYIENEEKYKTLSKEMLGESDDSDNESENSNDEDSDEDSEEEENEDGE